MMNVCKEFMQLIRKKSYKEVYLILVVDIFPQLTEYVCLLNDIKFEDGAYQEYYGEVKKIIVSFMTYWKFIIDDVIQEADKFTNVINREELLIIMDRTIDIHKGRQIALGKKYLPVQSQIEKQAYEEMENLYKQFMEKLEELKVNIARLDKQEKVDAFVRVHFKITVKRTSEIFETTHNFLAMMLADRLYNIRVSLEEILQRLRNNLIAVRSKCEENVIDLMQQLYEKNKEVLHISRQDRRCSIETAEANRGIEKIRSKIEQYSYDPPISRLEEEVAYWQERVNAFYESADKLIKLKKEQEDVIKQEQIYNSMKTTELPGSKKQCWLNMGENFAQRKQYLNERIIELAKTLMTFFSVRGTDRILYTDDIGPYYVDEFNHQVYVFNYGLGIYHKNCEGKFNEVNDKGKYYFDSFGRYVQGENGENIYQCAPCTSEYKVQASNNLLMKVTKDCGHSAKPNQKCALHIKDATRAGEVVPHVEPIDLKRTLEPEVVKYLWHSFGHVLPQALHDVGSDRTNNPIQHLAHKILFHKYNKTKNELREKIKEAQDYRTNIFKERKEKAVAASKEWKAKQVKHRKPEESDETDNQVIYNIQATSQAITDSMTYYCFE